MPELLWKTDKMFDTSRAKKIETKFEITYSFYSAWMLNTNKNETKK